MSLAIFSEFSEFSLALVSFSGPYFTAFGLNTDQKNSEYGHSLRSEEVLITPLRIKTVGKLKIFIYVY